MFTDAVIPQNKTNVYEQTKVFLQTGEIESHIQVSWLKTV